MSNPRFLAKFEQSEEGCWYWTAAKDWGGYGVYYDGLRQVGAHRYAYKLFVGPIHPGMQIDHLCGVTSCVNPAHLEEVTPRENVLRSRNVAAQNARKTACPSGHPYSGTDYSGRRICHPCQSQRQRRYRARGAA